MTSQHRQLVEYAWGFYVMSFGVWLLSRFRPPPPDSLEARLCELVSDTVTQIEVLPAAQRPLCLLCNTAPWRQQPFDPKTIHSFGIALSLHDPQDELLCALICHACADHARAFEMASSRLQHTILQG